MSDTKKVITTVREVNGILLSDDAAFFANDNGQLVQVPVASLNINGTATGAEIAGDEEVDALLEALDVPTVTNP